MFYVAEELGYFREAGLTTELVHLSASKDMIPFMAQGQLDIAGSGVSAGLFNAIRREIPLRIVADKATGRAAGFGGALAARKDLVDGGELRGVADLRGRRVAVSGTGAHGHYFLARALAAVGLSVQQDMEIMQIGFPEMPAAIANRALDAAMTVDPILGAGERSGLWTPLIWEDEIAPGHTAATLAYAPQFVEQDAALGQRFMVGYLRALRLWYERFITGQRPRADLIPILIEHSALKNAETWERYRSNGVNPNGSINLQGLADEQEWYVANGYMTDRLDLDQVVDYRFLDFALQQLGRYPE
jgi:NitT/TauT family transport system substrate-binding protein